MRYDPKLGDNRSLVRLYLGDTVLGDGPRPDRRNFSDDEIDAMLTAAGSWQCALARLFEVLAAEWTARPISGPGELGIVHDNAARQYNEMASLWRDKCASLSGTDATVAVAGSSATTRVDGYSEDYRW